MALKTFNPTPRQEEPRSEGRWMNPDDFEKKYGYDYTDDPNFNSREDAGGGIGPTHTERDPNTGLLSLQPRAGSQGRGEGQVRSGASTATGGSAVRRNIEKKKTLLTSKAN